jgi:hypothetical protein
MLRCAACGQIIHHERAGVRLTPMQAAIFDAIKSAGDAGVTSAEIVSGSVYRDRRPVSSTTIKAHVWQINELLEATDFIIVSDRRGWFLVRRVLREAAE